MSLPPRRIEQFYSSMAVPQNEIRTWMSQQYDLAYSEWHTSFGQPFRIERARELFSRIHTVGGIEIVEPSDFAGSHMDYGAAHYVFGKHLLEPWAAPRFRTPREFDYTPLVFLREHGYDLKTKPNAGDVIAYSRWQHEADLVTQLGAFAHYGIVNADGTITSKFGVGDVLNHAIDEVPSVAGDFAHFLGRTAIHE